MAASFVSITLYNIATSDHENTVDEDYDPIIDNLSVSEFNSAEEISKGLQSSQPAACELPFKLPSDPKTITDFRQKVNQVNLTLTSSYYSRNELDILFHYINLPIFYLRQEQYAGTTNAELNISKKLNHFSQSMVKEDLNTSTGHVIEQLMLGEDIGKKSLEDILEQAKTYISEMRQVHIVEDTSLAFLSLLHAKGAITNEKQIHQVLDMGYVPLLIDLVYFTAAGFNAELLTDLYNASQANVAFVFITPTHMESLSSVAVKFGNVDAAIFWSGLGSPVNPDPYVNRAFLNFKNKQSEYTEEQKKALLSLIFAEPHIQADYREVMADYADIASTISFNTSLHDANFEKGELAASVISDHVPKYIDAIFGDNAQLMDKECQIFNLRKVMRALYPPGSFSSAVSPFVARTNIKREDSSQRDDEKTQPKQETTRPEQEASDAASTKLDEEKKQQEEISKAHSLIDAEVSAAENAEFIASLQTVIELAQNGEWDEALALANELDLRGESSLDFLLSISLYTAKSPDPIIDLIEMGATLPAGAYVQLITHDRHEFIKPLVDNGLNITESVIPDGDVIKEAVKFGSANMLEVLLENGARPNMDAQGLDALDVVLNRFSLSNEDASILALLMKTGITVEASHKGFTQKLLENKPNEYEYLVTTFPVLAL